MYKIIKRIIDIFLSVILIILFSPIMIVVTLIIHKDGGKAIFKQERSGLHNKPFTIYKFRTMLPGNDVHDFGKEDVITDFGKRLKDTSFDELPQLFNILKGDMSFIGPRPWITDYSNYFNEKQIHRLDVKPGLTGLAQCSGRNNLSIFDKINYDLEYVEKISLKMDMYIFIKTIKSVLIKEGSISSKFAIKNELDELKNARTIKQSYKIYGSCSGELWSL